MARRPRKPAASAPPARTDAPERKPSETDDVHGEAMKRWQRAYERERENIDLAYLDLSFRIGEQWDPAAEAQRRADSRPVLTFNRMSQFVKQITGDIRQMRPAIRVVPVDDKGDKGVAEILAGMVRYIETRSDADRIYFQAADSQVAAGIGHWRIVTEYASDSTFEQELAVELVQDGVAVLWDPDAQHPTRRDARWCIVPVDLSREEFKERYPKATADSLPRLGTFSTPATWVSEDVVRIGEYWVKEPTKKRLVLGPDGSVDDITDDEDGEAKARAVLAAGGRVETREGFRIRRYVISASEILEGPDEWKGRYIPIVPLIGEETRIGRRLYRNGIIRHAKDAQRAYNYARSTEIEVVALQPKAPFMATIDQVKDNMDQWQTANAKNWPVLLYRPDPQAPTAVPQRVAPPVGSAGIAETVAMAAEDMKAVIGIYDASLGARSNEQSGKAIVARQREGDTGAFVYIDNFALAVQHTGRVLIDMIPHVYDTPRVIRVIGEDGKIDVVPINRPAGAALDGAAERVENDVTVGAYDVALEMGPSYTTKREEAREGMLALVQANPGVFPLIGDLFVKAQDWPLADKIAKRLQTTLPPQIAMQEAAESGEPPPPPPPPPPPDPKVEADMEKARADVAIKQIDLEIKRLQLMVEEAKAAAALSAPTDIAGLDQRLAALSEAILHLQAHAAYGLEPPEGMDMPPPEPEPPMMPMAEGPDLPPQQPPSGGFFNAPGPV